MLFQVEFNEALGKWRYRAGEEAPWSEYHRIGRLVSAMNGEVMEPASSGDPRFSKPIDHAVKSRRGPTEGTPLYEIVGKRVQRIATTSAERKKQQMDELAAIIEGLV